MAIFSKARALARAIEHSQPMTCAARFFTTIPDFATMTSDRAIFSLRGRAYHRDADSRSPDAYFTPFRS